MKQEELEMRKVEMINNIAELMADIKILNEKLPVMLEAITKVQTLEDAEVFDAQYCDFDCQLKHIQIF